MGTDMTVAKTILEQLGGNKFLAMTGAKDLVFGPTDLRMRLPIGKAKKVRITLEANDTYRVEFLTGRGQSWRVLADLTDIYADGLREVFEKHTGLATRL